MEQQQGKKVWETVWGLAERLVRFFLNLFFRLLHREPSEEIINGFLQFVKFGLIGVSNTVVSYLIYALSLLLFSCAGWTFRWDYVVANMIAFALSVLWSYYWNSRLVFTVEEGEERCWWKTLLRTYAAYAFTGLILSNVLSFVWVELVHAPKMIAPILNLVISVPINFLLNKLWSYRKRN